MPNMSDLAVALASLKTAREIAEADPAAFQKRQTEVLSKLLDAYGAVFKAQEEQTELLSRIRELESIGATKERYEKVSLGQNVIAYALKQALRETEPPHYLCADCLHAGKVSFLQQLTDGDYWTKYHCNTHGELVVEKGRPRQTSALPRRAYRDY